jgi:CRISPR-associated protein Cas1
MRVVEVSQQSAMVRIKDGCLSICLDGSLLGSVPVAEVGCVLLSSPHATCSVAALAALSAHGTPVIVCDKAMRPTGMMLPFRGQHEVATRMAAQATASLPLRRRLWKSIVKAKIAGQAAILAEATGSDHHLGMMMKRVKAGDPENVEGQAARRYWSRLFGASFRRRRGEGIENKMLDYGYAILRAAVARSLSVAGLHPGLGIHHHHRSNAFALADDLIEPFRPAVDRVVVACRSLYETHEELSPPLKRKLATCLDEAISMAGEQRAVQDAVGRSASSLAGVFLGERQELSLPWIG